MTVSKIRILKVTFNESELGTVPRGLENNFKIIKKNKKLLLGEAVRMGTE